MKIVAPTPSRWPFQQKLSLKFFQVILQFLKQCYKNIELFSKNSWELKAKNQMLLDVRGGG